MKLKYDLHLHSCLSPCGDDEMTPYNLANMAKICGCDIIALTDHNSCLNCQSTMRAGEEIGLTVVPGMELCTSEEIHCVCLFPELKNALDFSDYVKAKIPPVKNKEKIFGRQLIADEKDGIKGSFDLLLTTAAFISIEEVPKLISDFGGVWYPAHIDRHSYSIVSALGEFPKETITSAYELTYKGDCEVFKEKYPILRNKNLIRSSDAHYLEKIMTEKEEIDLSENTAKALIEKLKYNSSL